MTQHEHSTVVGVFQDSDRTRDAIQALKDAGFAAQDIGILMKDRGDAKDMAEETGTHAGEGAATGLIGGGILGGLAGWLVGIGALAIPGVGPFIAAGAFGTALAGAGIGAGIGAIAGALVGMGIPKEEAEFYEGEVRQGRTLVTVTARNRYAEARDILRQYGAYDVHDRTGADTGRMATTGTTTGRMSTTDTGTYGSSTMGSGRWEDVMPEYRNRWQQRYGNRGGNYRWEDYEPGYRYAYDMYNRPEYRNKSWNEVEPEFRRDWQNRYHDKPWDRFGESIHDAWDNLTHHGDQSYRGETTTRGTMAGDRMTEDRQTMQLREEELRARKERETVGEVGAHKEVVSEEKSMDVPVTHEEVYIERHPVDRPSDKPVGVNEDQNIRMRVQDEKVIPEKETFVREEVEMGKRPVQGTEHVSDTVRREELKVDRQGDFDIIGGEGYGPHEHKWVGDRCEICGATRRQRRAA